MEMMMNLFRTSVAAALVVAGAFAASGASAYERWVEIANTARVSIVEVRISDVDNRNWGPNILYGSIGPMASGVVDPVKTRGYCRFDVQVTYADGLVADIYNVNLCEALTISTDGYYYDVTTI
jgi:hypothetical protein